MTFKKRILLLSSRFIIIVVLASVFGTSFLLSTNNVAITAITKGMDKQPFHLTVEPLISSLAFNLYGAIPIIQNDSIVESTELVWFSQALFNIGNKSGNYQFYPEQDDPEDPIYITEYTELLILDNSYLQTVKDQFEIIGGNFSVDRQSIAISKRLAERINDSCPHDPIYIGKYVNFSMITRVADLEYGEFELHYWEPYNFTEMRIGSIFDRKATESIYYPTYNKETLGDCLFVSSDLVPLWVKVRLTRAAFSPRLYVRLDKYRFIQQGVLNARETIAGLKDRIYNISAHSMFGTFLVIREYTDEIYEAIDLSHTIMTVFLPVGVLSVIVVSFIFVAFINLLRRKKK